jgi:glycosyltransferase involved in cell wall biosynthesis
VKTESDPGVPRFGRPLRLMLLTSSLHYGGAERQVVQLAKYLDRRRFEPVLCCLDGTRTLFDLDPSPTPVLITRRRARFDPAPFFWVAQHMRRLGIDLVHCFLFDAEVIGRLSGRLTGVPAIIGSERNSDYPARPVKDRFQRLTRRWVDLVIANSHAGKRYVVGQLGFEPDRVAVVHNGVDTDRFRPGDRVAARQRLGLPCDGVIVGMFASFKPQKNHAMYFRVAKRVLERRPDISFLCVAHRPWNDSMAPRYEVSLRELLAELCLGDHLAFFVDRHDPEELYRACDVTVLTSRREGTPNVILESLASGRPVVATDIADNALILEAAPGSSVVPLDDDEAMSRALLELLNDPAALLAGGVQARQAALAHHSIASWVSRFSALYEETYARKLRQAHTSIVPCAHAD